LQAFAHICHLDTLAFGCTSVAVRQPIFATHGLIDHWADTCRLALSISCLKQLPTAAAAAAAAPNGCGACETQHKHGEGELCRGTSRVVLQASDVFKSVLYVHNMH